MDNGRDLRGQPHQERIAPVRENEEVVQKTLKAPVLFKGVGLHSGAPANLTVRPAAPNHGILFRRTDIRLGDSEIPAQWDRVNRTPLCTMLENAAGTRVSTIEHLMAALAGCGIHNALIEIDGPEVPILDYVACIEVEERGEDRGLLTWRIHYDEVEGEEFRRLLPIILPPITEESMRRLAPMIGGVHSAVRVPNS